MVNNKKNILIIVPHLSRGGAEMSAAKLSVDLSANKENNVVILTFFSELQYATTYTYNGQLISMNSVKKDSIVNSIGNFFKRIRFVRKIKRQYRIDYAISYLGSADFANILSAGREKVIVSIRSSYTFDSANWITKKAVKWLYNKANIIITQNKRIGVKFKEELKITDPEYVVISNYYDSETIQKRSEEPVNNLEKLNEYFIIGQIARLDYAKGQWHLLRIFNELRKRNDNLRLVIVGDGDMEDYLITYAKNLGLRTITTSLFPDDRIDLSEYDVCFLGFQANPFKYLSIIDVFLFTSLHEGFPNALAEAMICGKFVISTDCETGPLELIAPDIQSVISYPYVTKYGYLMPRFSGQLLQYNEPILQEERLWIDSICRLIDDDDDQRANCGMNARERMKEYTKDRVIHKWENLLNY